MRDSSALPQNDSNMGFKDNVISIIKKIPEGKVTTYGTVATMANMPRGARLVGGILHYNTEKYDLPWQRVVNRHGYISTSCFDHLKEAQRALLRDEGIEVSDEFVVDLDKYGWFPFRHSERSEESQD